MFKGKVKSYWETATPMSFIPEKWTYKQKRRFRYNLQSYMHQVFKFHNFEGKRVLDIGCGSGIDSIEFAKYGAEVHAIDVTQNACNFTYKLAVEAKHQVKVTQARADRLPYRDSSFDCVYSFGVLHHIAEVDDTLREIQRVLKPRGEFLGMVYHKDSLLYAYSIQYLKGNTERIKGCPYAKVYTIEEAQELFSRFFKQVDINIHYNVIDTPLKRKVKFQLDTERLNLGWHLIILASK